MVCQHETPLFLSIPSLPIPFFFPSPCGLENQTTNRKTKLFLFLAVRLKLERIPPRGYIDDIKTRLWSYIGDRRNKLSGGHHRCLLSVDDVNLNGRLCVHKKKRERETTQCSSYSSPFERWRKSLQAALKTFVCLFWPLLYLLALCVISFYLPPPGGFNWAPLSIV